MTTSVKVCRSCGEEYRRDVLRCADCGGELVERWLDESGEVVEPEETEAPAEEPAGPPPDHRVAFVTPRAADLVPLVEALRESDVPYHLTEQPARTEGAPPQYALLVPDARAAAALQAIAPLLATEESADLAHVETRFDSEKGYLQCPACGAPRPATAAECPECGLGLGDAEEAPACARCGAPLADPTAVCPNCDGGGAGG